MRSYMHMLSLALASGKQVDPHYHRHHQGPSFQSILVVAARAQPLLQGRMKLELVALEVVATNILMVTEVLAGVCARGL